MSMTDEEVLTLIATKTAYLARKRMHRVIKSAAAHHAFNRGTVVALRFCKSAYIGKTKTQVWEAVGKNAITGKQTAQVIVTQDLKRKTKKRA